MVAFAYEKTEKEKYKNKKARINIQHKPNVLSKVVEEKKIQAQCLRKSIIVPSFVLTMKTEEKICQGHGTPTVAFLCSFCHSGT